MRFESTEQIIFVARVKQFLPGVFLFSVPNGGDRRIKEAVRLKAEGVLAGVPDLMIAEPRRGYHGLFIEMKRKVKSRVSEAQAQAHTALIARGYDVVVCYGADEAWYYLLEYLGNDAPALLLQNGRLAEVTRACA